MWWLLLFLSFLFPLLHTLMQQQQQAILCVVVLSSSVTSVARSAAPCTHSKHVPHVLPVTLTQQSADLLTFMSQRKTAVQKRNVSFFSVQPSLTSHPYCMMELWVTMVTVVASSNTVQIVCLIAMQELIKVCKPISVPLISSHSSVPLCWVFNSFDHKLIRRLMFCSLFVMLSHRRPPNVPSRPNHW